MTTNQKATLATRKSSKPPQTVLQAGDQGNGQAQEAMGVFHVQNITEPYKRRRELREQNREMDSVHIVYVQWKSG